ncbi:MAG: tyrosine-type recombinase/integrase [Lachnospiraceae bacterium]|nr:tyrosine-type recombinase/integrase [Lachnospiraceae bacterium]
MKKIEYRNEAVTPSVSALIRDIDRQKKDLLNLENKGIVEGVGVAINELNKKEFKLKEEQVLKIHSNAITQTMVEKHGRMVPRYQTRCGNVRPRCSTYEGLIEKLYALYFEGVIITDYSFRNIFELALEEKIRKEDPKEKTVRDIRSSYKAFITDEFGGKDIRRITKSQLMEYIQEVSKELCPTKKRFYKLKGVLNLVFDYACDTERRILDVNPVPKDNKVFQKNITPSSKHPEDKAFQPKQVQMIQDYLWQRVRTQKYDVNGFAILFSSVTGVREGEIPSLKWEDVEENRIHIHSQQNDELRDGIKVFYYNPTTKNEKGVSRGGRYFPITREVREILDMLKAKQTELGINSEWVFCKKSGEWITTVAYYEALYRVSKKLGLGLSNNHAFRIALNSYVLIPAGIEAPERARMLGHSVETNLRHYTFSKSDDYIDELCDRLDRYEAQSHSDPSGWEGVPRGTSKIMQFSTKEKSPESSKTQAFS